MNLVSRRTATLTVFAVCLLPFGGRTVADDVESLKELKSQGSLTVDDGFDRAELGEPWTVNDGRARRAGDLQSQAQLVDGVLQIQRSEKAGHGASVRRPVAFDDAVVEVRFRLPDEHSALAVNLNDKRWGKQQSPKRYGHLGRVQVGADEILIEDQKTSGLDPEFRKLKNSGASKEARNEWKDGKTRARFPAELTAGQWYTLTIVLKGQTVKVFLDGESAGESKGAGFDHPTKGLIAFAVPDAAHVDQLKIWELR